MKSIKDTLTEKNLVISYLNESTAYTRYTFYAQQADKESYYPVGVIFRVTAANELHHAKAFFKLLQGGRSTINITADAGVIGTTLDNLKTALEEEKNEGFEAYTAFAKVALEEGFPEISAHFNAIAAVERHHYDRFARYIKHLEDGTLWQRDTAVTWQCLVCGFTLTGKQPPKVCAACDHPYHHYMAIDAEDGVLFPD